MRGRVSIRARRSWASITGSGIALREVGREVGPTDGVTNSFHDKPPATGYRVMVRAVRVTGAHGSAPSSSFVAQRTAQASCARAAACELGSMCVDAGMVVDWYVRRTGLEHIGQRWSGRFMPEGGDDGLAGVREVSRPRPCAGMVAGG